MISLTRVPLVSVLTHPNFKPDWLSKWNHCMSSWWNPFTPESGSRFSVTSQHANYFQTRWRLEPEPMCYHVQEWFSITTASTYSAKAHPSDWVSAVSGYPRFGGIFLDQSKIFIQYLSWCQGKCGIPSGWSVVCESLLLVNLGQAKTLTTQLTIWQRSTFSSRSPPLHSP